MTPSPAVLGFGVEEYGRRDQGDVNVPGVASDTAAITCV